MDGERRRFLRAAATAAAGLAVYSQLPLAGLPELVKEVEAAVPTRRHANTPPLGDRWVWVQPIRGDWMYPGYSQADLAGLLGAFSRVDVLHRAIDQGFKGLPQVPLPGGGDIIPQYFTVESLAQTVRPWVQLLKDSYSGVKVIGRISCGMIGYSQGEGLDPSDPELLTPFEGFPTSPSPYDMDSPVCQQWMSDWGVRYFDNLGVDGIWYDNTELLLNQSKKNWNVVYSDVHSSAGDSFWVCSNTNSTLKGMKDTVENNVGQKEVCAMGESVDWALVESEAVRVGDLPSPRTPLTLHLDFPGTFGKFAQVQPYGGKLSVPCLDFSGRAEYLDFFARDMQSKGYCFEWPVLAGDPGYGYDSTKDLDPADPTTSMFDHLAAAVNSLP